MRNIKVIRTDAEYATAMRELDAYQLAQPNDGTVEAERMELLSVLVRAYEAQRLDGDPVDAIKLYLARLGKTTKDLEGILKCTRHRVWEILNRKRALTLSQIRALVSELDIPSDLLITEYPVVRAVNARAVDNDHTSVMP